MNYPIQTVALKDLVLAVLDTAAAVLVLVCCRRDVWLVD